MTEDNVIVKRFEELTHHERLAFLTQEFLRLGPERFNLIECPVTHYFAPGIYMRELFMPAGSIIIGKIHRTEHLNIVEKGRLHLLNEDGTVEEIIAPKTFVSKAGVQKAARVYEDTVWKTVHPTDETDIATLEALLTEPSPIVRIEGMAQELLT